jgi:hypothetical protein
MGLSAGHTAEAEIRKRAQEKSDTIELTARQKRCSARVLKGEILRVRVERTLISKEM